jgi:hypothetical protein
MSPRTAVELAAGPSRAECDHPGVPGAGRRQPDRACGRGLVLGRTRNRRGLRRGAGDRVGPARRDSSLIPASRSATMCPRPRSRDGRRSGLPTASPAPRPLPRPASSVGASPRRGARVPLRTPRLRTEKGPSGSTAFSRTPSPGPFCSRRPVAAHRVEGRPGELAGVALSRTVWAVEHGTRCVSSWPGAERCPASPPDCPHRSPALPHRPAHRSPGWARSPRPAGRIDRDIPCQRARPGRGFRPHRPFHPRVRRGRRCPVGTDAVTVLAVVARWYRPLWRSVAGRMPARPCARSRGSRGLCRLARDLRQQCLLPRLPTRRR